MNTADIRIADHVRTRGRSVPENSVSYKFIEQSVKNRSLEDADSHRITDAVRNRAVINRSSRGGRVPFTAADDQILSNWVSKQEKEGRALSGNVIYKELEEMCPHHSWQSWKGRYTNYKRLLPKPKEMATQPASQPLARAAPTHSSSRILQAAPSAPGPSQSTAPAVTGSGRVKFSKEDDQLLLDYVAETGGNTSGNKIYQQLAEEYPHHSWHSWRDRYVRHLEPRLRSAAAEKERTPPVLESQKTATKKYASKSRIKSAEKGPAATVVPSRGRAVASINGADPGEDFPPVDMLFKRASRGQDHGLARAQGVPAQNGTNAAGPSLAASTTIITTRKEDDFELRLAGIKLAKLIQPRARGYIVRSALRKLENRLPQLQAASRGVLLRSTLRDFIDEDLERFQADTRGALKRMKLRQRDGHIDRVHSIHGPMAQTTAGGDADPELPLDLQSPKEQFYELLNEYLEASGAQINHWPKIQGRTLQLWELWNAVKSLDQGRSPGSRNWEHIAENLGFDWVETPDVTSQLKTCYETNLGGFEALEEEFEDQDPGSEAELDSEGSYLDEGALPRPTERVIPSEPLPFRSSPPPVVGQKRAFEPDPEVSLVEHGLPSAKRMRYSKDMVIPSSPEQEKTAATRSSARAYPPHSPPHDLSQAHLQPQKNKLEPETQDFGFEDDFQFQSAPDTTPSQQLHVENNESSPIPFSGFKLSDVPERSARRLLQFNSIQHRTVLDSAGVRRTNDDNLVLRTDDPGHDCTDAEPHLAERPRSPSPIEARAKRRSLPASFHRAVTPPKATPQLAARVSAAARVSLPTRINNNGRVTITPASRLFPDHASRETSAYKTVDRPSLRRPTHSGSPGSVASAPPRIIPNGPIPREGSSLSEKVQFYRSLGYSRTHVKQAFEATLTWGLAAVVMEELKNGRGISDNWAGVWTAKDDGDLKFVLAAERDVGERKRSGKMPGREDRESVRRAERLRRRLVVKHGMERVEDRIVSFGTLG
jgi:hypothetical protein